MAQDVIAAGIDSAGALATRLHPPPQRHHSPHLLRRKSSLFEQCAPIGDDRGPTAGQLQTAEAGAMEYEEGQRVGPGGQLLPSHRDDEGHVCRAGAVLQATVSRSYPHCNDGRECSTTNAGDSDTQSTTHSRKARSRPAFVASTHSGGTQLVKNVASLASCAKPSAPRRQSPLKPRSARTAAVGPLVTTLT